MSPLAWLGVGLIGGLGAMGRLLLDGFVSERAGGRFPWGTFAVNISGAAALGLLAGLALHGDAFVLASAGATGSFTTFSTWMLETDRSVEDGSVSTAVLNVAVTLVVGLAATELGRLLGEALS